MRAQEPWPKQRRGVFYRLYIVIAVIVAIAYISTFSTTKTVGMGTDATTNHGSLAAVDLQSPSQVHGWVHKGGPAAMHTWHSSADAPRRAAWDAFIKARASGHAAMDAAYDSVPPHGPDPWGCRLYFNRNYKLFFVRTAKTGSTTILEAVLPACVKAPELPHCFERVADTEMSVEEVSELWKEYTAFTFTRNVWSRAISQYQYLVHFVRGNASQLRCQRVGWDDFCADPLVLGSVCREEPRCCTKKWTHQDWHMRQQTSCFLTDRDPPEWAVDFIGRLEHFDEDLQRLFDAVNAKRAKGLPPLVYAPPPPANSNPNACTDSDDARDQQAVIEANTSGSSISSKGQNAEDEYADYDAEGGSSSRRLQWRQRRRLAGEFSNIDGNQLSDVAYCDKNKYYQGKHAVCLSAMTNFFARDVQLLHGDPMARSKSGAANAKPR